MSDANGSSLSVIEIAKLENLEVVIDGGLKSFVDVGRALMEIREGKLHRATHSTFEAYCQERWQMTPQHANRLATAAETIDCLEPIGSAPTNESQVRPLTRLPIDQRSAAWREAEQVAPNGKPTAAIVEQVVASRLPEVEVEEEPQPKVSRSTAKEAAEKDAADFQEKFAAAVAKVCDGGVYTNDTLVEVTGFNQTSIVWFLRMCDISPFVKVHRNAGKKNLIQFSFEKTNCVTAHARIKQLAQQIADDSVTGARSLTAAKKILSLLGG